MECEICGRETDKVSKVKFEGMEVLACERCAGLGEKVKEATPAVPAAQAAPGARPRFEPRRKVTGPRPPEFGERVLAKNFQAKIQKARQRKNLTLQELAQKIFEKQSILRKVESGAMQPSDSLVKKLEKFYGFSLREKSQEEE